MVGKPKSCTPCRQAKVACDAPKKAPEACSRCAKKQYQCRFDAKFKRIATRQIAQDITNEHLQNLRDSQNTSTSDGSQSSEPACPLSLDTSPSQCASPEIGRPFFNHVYEAGHSPFTLDGVAVSSDIVTELLHHFEEFYYPHAPFLQPIQDVSQLAADWPLLFWTIVLTACEHHPLHSSLYAQILLPHRALLTPISNSAIQSVEEVHAILLLCLWPIVRQNPSQDPSWSYVGIATSYCVKMNYHKVSPFAGPGLPLTQVPIAPEVRSLTMLACFTISTQISMFLGFEPSLGSSHHLRNIRKAASQVGGVLSHHSRANVALSEIVCSYAMSLEEVDDPLAKLSTARMFDDKLHEFRQRSSSHWSSQNEILFQYARLNLYLTVLIPPAHISQTQDIEYCASKHTLLYRGLDSALSLIRHVKNLATLSEGCERENCGELQYHPRTFFTATFFAAIFLFRLIINDEAVSSMHRTCAVDGLTDVLEVFSRFPNNRDAARAAVQIEDLVSKARSPDHASVDNAFPRQLVVNDRLGASWLWDTVLRCHWKENGVNGPAGRSSGPLEDMLEDRLPSPPEVESHMMYLYSVME